MLRNRSYTDAEVAGNRLIWQAPREEGEDLTLARRQLWGRHRFALSWLFSGKVE